MKPRIIWLPAFHCWCCSLGNVFGLGDSPKMAYFYYSLSGTRRTSQ